MESFDFAGYVLNNFLDGAVSSRDGPCPVKNSIVFAQQTFIEVDERRPSIFATYVELGPRYFPS